jgi:ATP-dependent Clp protease adaptor protein ClpS
VDTAATRPVGGGCDSWRLGDAVGPLIFGQNDAMPPITAPVVVDRPDVDEVVANDRPWIVLVWNDPINLMSYVTFVFQKVFGYSLEKATELMLDVHHKGRAVVSSGAREKAEIDVFRLHEHGLWATMQQDD